MDRYINRCIDRAIDRDLGIFGAVLVQGPKWCGKTTTSKRFAASSLSLSDPSGGFAARQLAELDPAGRLSVQYRGWLTSGRRRRAFGMQCALSVMREAVNPASLSLLAQRRHATLRNQCIAESVGYQGFAWTL